MLSSVTYTVSVLIRERVAHLHRAFIEAPALIQARLNQCRILTQVLGTTQPATSDLVTRHPGIGFCSVSLIYEEIKVYALFTYPRSDTA